MKKNQKYEEVCLAALLMVLFSWLPINGQAEFERTERPKNVILMIGDGMGISQLTSAYYFNDEKDDEWEPSFSRFRYIGLAKTSSGLEVVTQSSAAATALATGYKTYNMAVGVDMDTVVRENIVEIL